MINSGIDYLHFDICDGHFVPNITFGYPVIKSIRSKTNFYFCVHLMVTNPELWLDGLYECKVCWPINKFRHYNIFICYNFIYIK